ncbi:MAG: peptidoglycan synthetase, partial [Bacteroidales bacterium]|nr:peptidoglycan synthetase [Bacteroidales bacterium]
HVTIITGVAWDHINVFPTYDDYCHQFELLLENMEPDGKVFYYEHDNDLVEIVNRSQSTISTLPYKEFESSVLAGKTRVLTPQKTEIELQIFGNHNLANLAAARLACLELGVTESQFWAAAETFTGAAKRLQNLVAGAKFSAWLDFAHAPSKARATVKAVKQLNPARRLVACLELHTFSSLNKAFLPLYADSLDPADVACVFYSPHTLEMKKMPPIQPAEIREAFGLPELHIFTQSTDFQDFLSHQDIENTNLLLMSSGNFGGMDIPIFVKGLS